MRTTHYKQSHAVIIKWFNSKKGFGFVVLSDGSGHAFLHKNVLARSGIFAAQAGDTLEVRVNLGRKGLHVTEVLKIYRLLVGELGTVKSFETDKGCGFIASDRGGREIFVCSVALKRSEIATLTVGQRVIFDIADGRERPKVKSIRLC